MEREIKETGLMMRLPAIALTAVVGVVLWSGFGTAQRSEPTAGSDGAAAGKLTLSEDCRYQKKGATQSVALHNVARALKQKRVVKILVMGGSGATRQGAGNDGGFLVEQLLEKAVRGLRVELVDRGISGELTRDAADRLKVEVALAEPDLVLWQVGTMDALAGIPVQQIEETITQSVRWLREHGVDVILVGLQYARPMTRDRHYQKVRAAVRRIARIEKVLRVGRYEAEEILDKAQASPQGPAISEFDQSENSYNCVAEYVAKSIVSGLFIKRDAAPKRP